ncbi:MAG TPA: energy transducer TonB [Acidobacteriaceae bacterium]|jgi:TonB family protein|nr:energy transducer TonB [Acidobacteriaceae bacterium]
MRHLPIVRPLAALVTACLMTTPFASSQAPISSATAPAPTGAQAVQPASTPEALSAALVGKTFYLRGFYQDDKLEFATDGKPVGSPQRGSFALSAVEIDKVKFTKHSMEIEAHRVGLHFFGALPYEDDTKPFERIKVDPKKAMNIEIDRLVIEPEKKKKKKDDKGDKKDGKEIAAKPTAASPASDTQDDETDTAALPSAPETSTGKAATTSTATPAGTATVAAAPTIAPNHDPRVSFLQLSKAVNVIFAPALDDSVIATLPEYWQNYFATKAGKARAQRVDASAMRPGGDVKPPHLLTVLDPASNDYAQKNNIAGMVFLQMVVDAQGHPGEVTIVRPIGFGLDEMAVDAVKHAQFRAGTLNGKPVAEVVNLQVTFRIYSNRTKPHGGSVPTQVAPKETPKMPPSNAPVLASAGTVSE